VHSVYAQHQWYFNENWDDICPREAFTRDLCIELDLWLAMGDKVVILLDANDDMKQGTVATRRHQRIMGQWEETMQGRVEHRFKQRKVLIYQSFGKFAQEDTFIGMILSYKSLQQRMQLQ
jgi:hypothetical protein